MQRYLIERANKLSQEVDARTDLLALREILEAEGVKPTDIWRIRLGLFHYIGEDEILSALVTVIKEQPIKKTLFKITEDWKTFGFLTSGYDAGYQIFMAHLGTFKYIQLCDEDALKLAKAIIKDYEDKSNYLHNEQGKDGETIYR